MSTALASVVPIKILMRERGKKGNLFSLVESQLLYFNDWPLWYVKAAWRRKSPGPPMKAVGG